MIKKKIIIIFALIFLAGCGYKPIFSSKEKSFAINNIDFLQKKQINSKIKNKLKIYKNTGDKQKQYNLKINLEQSKNIISKDSKGNPNLLSMKIKIELDVIKNNKSLGKKIFSESFNYKNSKNKFSLKQYEENIENNIINKIIQKIIIHLHLF